jgi:kinesin light chain
MFFYLEPLCKRALEIREKIFGVDHPDVGKQLNNLALLCLNQGKYDKVEEYYQRAIEIYTKSYGRNDSNVLKTKNNLASAYLREGKYQFAAQLYQEILSDSQSTTTPPPDLIIINTTFKNLSALYRRLGLSEQADLLESYATKSSSDQNDIINRALNILQETRMNDDIMRRSQVSSSQEYGKLRRSGSFQKLRQSIRRGSEKLVQKLRGTPPTNLPPVQQDNPIKRASSMSVLNQPFPLQQQQTNRTLANTCSIDQQQQQNKQFIPPSRGRLTSAENLH